MIRINTKVINGETSEQYLWRLGNNREALGLTWNEIADLINKEFRADDDALTESSYRKKYAAAKLFYDEVFNREEFKSDDTQERLREIERAKVALRDERTSYNSQNRDAARRDENFKYLAEKLQEIGRTEFTGSSSPICTAGDSDLICLISDVHLGSENYSVFGCYNSEIAKQRLDDYLIKVIEIGKRHSAETVYVCLLGDLVNGIIRTSVRLANREDLINQIKLAAQYLSSFCLELSKHFKQVVVTGVPGNHSRLFQSKEDCLRDERVDCLVLWIIKQILAHVDNIKVEDELYDASVTSIWVRGKQYCLVHGDDDNPTDAGVGKLALMLGSIPYAILAGHRHSPFYKDINNCKYIQAGSLCSGGDYETQKRLTGTPSQTTLVVNENGIEAIYNIELN